MHNFITLKNDQKSYYKKDGSKSLVIEIKDAFRKHCKKILFSIYFSLREKNNNRIKFFALKKILEIEIYVFIFIDFLRKGIKIAIVRFINNQLFYSLIFFFFILDSS